VFGSISDDFVNYDVLYVDRVVAPILLAQCYSTVVNDIKLCGNTV